MHGTETASTNLGYPMPGMLKRSWDRSRRIGISASDRLMFNEVSAVLRKQVRERNRQLIAAAMPEMTNLRNLLGNSAWMVACVGDDGMVIDALRNPAAHSAQLNLALRTGVALGEHVVGTNGPGCALAERKPVIVEGSDHYLQEAKRFTCIAVPLFDPLGSLLGALDASCDIYDAPRSNSSLIFESLILAGRAVENRLLYGLDRAIFVRFHQRTEMLDTPLAGILAFSEDGYLLGLNQAARHILAMNFPEDARASFDSLFDLAFHAAMDRSRATQHAPLWLDSANGMRLFARIEQHRKFERDTQRAFRAGKGVESPPPRFVTEDARLRQMLDRAQCVFARDIPILINGETGTGKEVVARLLHEGGPRANGPFVAINCASIPATLIESELFGYVDGAFTGGRRGGAAGKLEAANGGTLFLDEIGDMPVDLQARLLRVLQERSFSRIGSAKPIDLDISVICATHCDLMREIEDGSFREDLFYRINGLRIEVPPLRERTDIKALIDRILTEAAAGHEVPNVSDAATHALLRYSWPGNIRQLQHVLRLAAALAEARGCIEIAHLPEEIGNAPEWIREDQREGDAQSLPRLRETQLRLIRASLLANNGNISLTARSLGITRQTLYRKIAEHKIQKQ